MNKVYLIGNLTRDPEKRTTQSGISLCDFSIAVNRRRSSNAQAGQPEADFFRVTAWRQLGDICAQYLHKGSKVCVVGTVTASAYVGKDGLPHASLEVTADDLEMLTSRREDEAAGYVRPAAPAPGAYSAPAPAANVGSVPQGGSYEQVQDDELPF